MSVSSSSSSSSPLISDSKPSYKMPTWTRISLILVMFLGCVAGAFIVYDYYTYPGNTETPSDIKMMRNMALYTLCFTYVVLMCLSIFLTIKNRKNHKVISIILMIYSISLVVAMSYVIYFWFYVKSTDNIPDLQSTLFKISYIYAGVPVAVGLVILAIGSIARN